MEKNDLITYLSATFTSFGVMAILFIWVRNLLDGFGATITGIWSNSDHSLRVLIYNSNSAMHGDVVWTNSPQEHVLGWHILKHIKLNFFNLGTGEYIDPLTGKHYHFKLRLVKKELLHLYVADEKGLPVWNEQWNLVSAK
jgi:hypothetical protein